MYFLVAKIEYKHSKRNTDVSVYTHECKVCGGISANDRDLINITRSCASSSSCKFTFADRCASHIVTCLGHSHITQFDSWENQGWPWFSCWWGILKINHLILLVNSLPNSTKKSKKIINWFFHFGWILSCISFFWMHSKFWLWNKSGARHTIQKRIKSKNWMILKRIPQPMKESGSTLILWRIELQNMTYDITSDLIDQNCPTPDWCA